MTPPIIELTEAPPTEAVITQPGGFVMTASARTGLLVIVLGVFYLRLRRRRRTRDRICSHCGHRNAAHQTNCAKCSKPLPEGR